MDDVLTPEEASSLALTKARLADSPGLVSEEENRLAGAVTRLVSEVERLRARNEALEKVAEEAKKFRETYLVYFDEPEDDLMPNTGPRLDAALAALNPPTSDGSGGGA